MAETNRVTFAIETRSSQTGPRLVGVALTEGIPADGGRAEVFQPGAVDWPSTGVALRTVHHGAEECRAIPTRDGNVIRIDAPCTPALHSAVQSGARYMSLEFHSVAEHRTAGGVRSIEKALMMGACVVREPEYLDTRVEVRTAQPARYWF